MTCMRQVERSLQKNAEDEEVKALSHAIRSRQDMGEGARQWGWKESLSKKRRVPFEHCADECYEEHLNILSTFREVYHQELCALGSGDPHQLLRSVQSFRKLLAEQSTITGGHLIEVGVLPKLIACLDRGLQQREVMALLVDLVPGPPSQARCLVESGAVRALVSLLWSEEPQVMYQAAHALASLVEEHDYCAEVVTGSGAVPGLVHALRTCQVDEVATRGLWLLTRLAEDHPDPSRLLQVLPVLHGLLVESSGPLLVPAWGLLAVLSAFPKLSSELFSVEWVQLVLRTLQRSSPALLYAFRAVSNLFEIDYRLALKRLGGEICYYLDKYIGTDDPDLLRQMCELAKHLSKHEDLQVTYRLWKHVARLDDERALDLLTSALLERLRRKPDEWLVTEELCATLAGGRCDSLLDKTLSCLELTLAAGETAGRQMLAQTNPAAALMERCGGLASLETLLSHQTEQIYRKAFHIMERFFPEQEGDSGVVLEEIYLSSPHIALTL